MSLKTENFRPPHLNKEISRFASDALVRLATQKDEDEEEMGTEEETGGEKREANID